MATVHVFVGQCGNQVGTAFLDTVASEAEASLDEGYQMRVSATHFRPALRPPPGRRPLQRAAQTARSDDGAGRRLGPQHYYSLSRYANQPTADTHAAEAALPQPRCVLVDMEPKVIDATVQRANRYADTGASTSATTGAARRFYTLAPQQCVTRGEGSGNNWAFGYHQQGQSRRDAIAECLRRESEQQGTVVSTFHVLHSIAGGTGSGVSCLVAEEVRAMFPRAALLHSVVWPFRCGEVVTQWYNVLMAVSTLRDLADGVCITYNDVIAEGLKGAQASRGLRDAGEVSYQLMNQRISEVLAPLHLPQLLYAVPTPQKDVSKNRIVGPGARRGLLDATSCCVADGTAPQRYATASDVVEALALDPSTKFFTGTLAPPSATGTTTWTAVLSEAARVAQHTFASASALAPSYSGVAAAPALDAAAFYMQHRSCLWALRGVAAGSDGLRELRHIMAGCGAAPFPMTSLLVSPVEAWRSSPAFTRPDHSAALYGPTPMIGETMADAAHRAEELLSAGAFVHHFERYGVTKEELRDAAAVLYDTAAAYCPLP